MMRELEAARFRIEQMLIERGAVCDQIDCDLIEPECGCYGFVAGVYCVDGSFFCVTVETAGPVEHFEPRRLERQLWPRTAGAVLH